MTEIYHVGNSMVVPQDNLNVLALREIFRKDRPMMFDENEIKVREFYDEVTKALPDFLNEKVRYMLDQQLRPSFYGEEAELRTDIRYTIPLQEGRVSASMTLAENLQKVLGKAEIQMLNAQERESLLHAVSGKKGIIVKGGYHDGFETGLNQGLCFDVYSQKDQGNYLETIRSDVKHEVLNALCESRKLNLLANQSYFSPLSFEMKEIVANIKDLRLETVAQAEPHISDFFSWIKSHSQEIQTVLVMGNLYHHLLDTEKKLEELDRSGKINLNRLPSYSPLTAEMIFNIINNLHPPQNKRMDYLVRSHGSL